MSLTKCPQMVEKEGTLIYPPKREVPTGRTVIGEGRRVTAPGPGGLCGHCVLVPALWQKPLPGLANGFPRGGGDTVTEPFLGGTWGRRVGRVLRVKLPGLHTQAHLGRDPGAAASPSSHQAAGSL